MAKLTKSVEITDYSTLTDMLSSIAECFAEKTALQHFNGSRWHRMSFSEMIQVSKAYARILQLSGVRPGDRIILIEENSIDWVFAFLAVLFSNATAVLIDPRMEPADFAQLIQKSSPQAILTSEKNFKKIPSNSLHDVPVFDINCQFKSFEGTPTCVDDSQFNPDGDPAIAVMMFTSGTTRRFQGRHVGTSSDPLRNQDRLLYLPYYFRGPSPLHPPVDPYFRTCRQPIDSIISWLYGHFS